VEKGQTNNANGRKSLLEKDPELIKQAGALLQAGNYDKTVYTALGISKQTWYSYLERGEAVRETINESEDPEATKAALTTRDALYLDFADTVTRASARGELGLVDTIHRARRGGRDRCPGCNGRKTIMDHDDKTKLVCPVCEGQGYLVDMDQAARHSEWMLERRFPDKYGRREQIDLGRPKDEDPLAEAVLKNPDAQEMVQDLLAIIANPEGVTADTDNEGEDL
jgi:hypothetical protein